MITFKCKINYMTNNVYKSFSSQDKLFFVEVHLNVMR